MGFNNMMVLVLLLSLWTCALAYPLSPESPVAERRSFLSPYELNPFFGYRRFREIRYEPMTAPFPALMPVGGGAAPGPAYGPAASPGAIRPVPASLPPQAAMMMMGNYMPAPVGGAPLGGGAPFGIGGMMGAAPPIMMGANGAGGGLY